ncbi:SUKH-3 domain-containing protein [Actinoplanes sp. CA-252034]|uniref:SUKH-3 domain-containing protein n=1 Tax=Actinoplanes sp. CA-252034 TaxID=3239906 RepID=UPI003D964E67
MADLLVRIEVDDEMEPVTVPGGDTHPYRFPPQVDEVMRRAGWYPGRSVDVERWRTGPGSEVSMHPAAERFLSEFGGLSIDVSGAGVDVGRDPFEFDPTDELGELGDEGRYAEWGEIIGRSLFPVGFFKREMFRLAIDENSVIYFVTSWLAGYGPAPRALERLVLGYKPQMISSEDG